VCKLGVVQERRSLQEGCAGHQQPVEHPTAGRCYPVDLPDGGVLVPCRATSCTTGSSAAASGPSIPETTMLSPASTLRSAQPAAQAAPSGVQLIARLSAQTKIICTKSTDRAVTPSETRGITERSCYHSDETPAFRITCPRVTQIIRHIRIQYAVARSDR